jgi:signal transduction histidine kinase
MASGEPEDYCREVLTRQLLGRYGDYVLAGLIGAVYLGEIWLGGNVADNRATGAVVAAAFAAALALRRRMPWLALVAGLAVIELDNTVIEGIAETGAFLVGFIVAIYSAGRYGRGRGLAASLVLMLAVPLAAFEPGEPVGLSDIAFFLGFFGGPFGAGRIVRYRSERERLLLDRTSALELERDEKARVAVVEERTRIARELHDVVAHAISVIVVQARGGRRVLDEEPDDAREAFDVIERAGEQALVEMRRLLEILRDDGEEVGLAPQPSLSRIGELAASLTSAGLPVEVTVEGDAVELPPGIDVSAYRIVQEALTNALKHAGPARAKVVVRYRPDELELEVLDDGAGTGNGGGSGHGLAGIRERVDVYGGALESGRRREGGYALRARLPLGTVR